MPKDICQAPFPTTTGTAAFLGLVELRLAFREVADALEARSAIDEQIDAQARVLDAQKERLKLAEESLVQARLLRLTNAVDLYRSLGGGLKETAAS